MAEIFYTNARWPRKEGGDGRGGGEFSLDSQGPGGIIDGRGCQGQGESYMFIVIMYSRKEEGEKKKLCYLDSPPFIPSVIPISISISIVGRWAAFPSGGLLISALRSSSV